MKLFWTATRHERVGGVSCHVHRDVGSDLCVWMRSDSYDLGLAFDVEGARQAIAALTAAVAEAESLEREMAAKVEEQP